MSCLRRISFCKAENGFPFDHAGSRACVKTSVTHRGIIRLGGIEQPNKPDIAHLSLTKDEE